MLPVRAARCATSARRWGCRRARSSARRARSSRGARTRRARHRAGDAAASASGASELAALAGARARWCREAHGLPRHSSQHPGGMVISTEPLIEICPIQPAAMEGRQMVQWDKDSCSDAGFLKIDLLGPGDALGGRALRGRDRARARRADRPLAHPLRRPGGVPRDPARRRRPACSRSRAARRCRCSRARCPRSLDDLTVQVALVRPGPIHGGAVHPYIERRKALRADPAYQVPYEHPSLEPVLKRHARRDRLPGPGDRGGDGVRRLLARARRRGCGGR